MEQAFLGIGVIPLLQKLVQEKSQTWNDKFFHQKVLSAGAKKFDFVTSVFVKATKQAFSFCNKYLCNCLWPDIKLANIRNVERVRLKNALLFNFEANIYVSLWRYVISNMWILVFEQFMAKPISVEMKMGLKLFYSRFPLWCLNKQKQKQKETEGKRKFLHSSRRAELAASLRRCHLFVKCLNSHRFSQFTTYYTMHRHSL